MSETKVHFTDNTWAVVSAFPSSGRMSIEEFSRIDQRFAGALGRRNVPLVAKANAEEVALTHEGLEHRMAMMRHEVFRSVSRLQSLHGNPGLAKCFDHADRRATAKDLTRRNLYSFPKKNGVQGAA